MLANWGIKRTLIRPHNPGCNGKIESLHLNLQRELLRRKELASLEEAQQEIAAYIRYYNHERPHQGIGGLTPADRYFGLAEEMNKYALHPHPSPRALYLTGKVEDAFWCIEELPQGGIALSLGGQELKRWPSTHDCPWPCWNSVAWGKRLKRLISLARVFRDVEDYVVSQITASTTLPQLLTMLAEEAYQGTTMFAPTRAWGD